MRRTHGFRTPNSLTRVNRHSYGLHLPSYNEIFEGKEGMSGGLRALANCDPPEANEHGMIYLLFVRLIPFHCISKLTSRRFKAESDGSFLRCLTSLGGPERVSTLMKLVKCGAR